MYVRLPVPDGDGQEWNEDFRSFRLGKIQSIDALEGTLLASMFRHPLGAPFAQEDWKATTEHVFRCDIAPESLCIHEPTSEPGIVLEKVSDKSSLGEPAEYYVSVGGRITMFPEYDLIVPADAQDPDPRQQMLRYELQEPGWRALRDPVIEAIADLRNATYGLEELVGSRVLLLPHQAEVITRALAAHVCRFVLADEVGLGKTIEAAVILKGLRRRQPDGQSLIVAPASLTYQWQQELNAKFWMDIPVLDRNTEDVDSANGLIVSAEDVAGDPRIRNVVLGSEWNCLVIDEAHHIRKNETLKNTVIELSRFAESVLVLSATPIEQRGGEYLDLLRIMDPHRYGPLKEETFQQLLDAQASIRSSIEYIRPTLTPSLYDSDEFTDELSTLGSLLPQDYYLSDALDDAQASGSVKLERALEIVTHVNTHYRVEDRVLRNRRAHLEADLPSRALETRSAYDPSDSELEALDTVLDYGEAVLTADPSPVAQEYVRLLIHGSLSSPQAIGSLLAQRSSSLVAVSLGTTLNDDMLIVRNQRDEPMRIRSIVNSLPAFSNEAAQVEGTLRAVLDWERKTTEELGEVTLRVLGAQEANQNRLVSVLQAVHKFTQQTERGSLGKVIVFSSWPSTLDVLGEHLTRIYGARCFAQFRAGMNEQDLEKAADIFQVDRTCQILLTDELGGEGRNFQIADAIVHVDLPWSPARIEQRIGRVDRLGRTGQVISVIPCAIGTVEEDLFNIWNSVFQLFSQSMSGLEIALEDVQSDLVGSLRESVRHGLNRLIPNLDRRIDDVRQQVERERFFEEGAINKRRRSEFQRIRDKYRDGKILERSVSAWASRAGLKHDYDQQSGITTFFPKHFNSKSMENANILTLPDMDEAIRRAGRRFTQSIRGTFSRDLAIQREDLVFFAPGDDPWFDWIVQNAERADRGRCCAIFRRSPHVSRPWKGLEVLYRIEVDPRPLYEIAASEIHLVKAQGYLNFPTYRVYISEAGDVLSGTSEFARATSSPYGRNGVKDVHFGQRSGTKSPLSQFKRSYPSDVWNELSSSLLRKADEVIQEEFSFMQELGEEARVELEDALRTANAIQSWQQDHLGMTKASPDNTTDRAIIDALVEGISRPRIRLESACYWWIAKV
jgi:hypothetical protein